MTESTGPRSGEVWRIEFDPAVGAEMKKTRPAVVVSDDFVGRLPLRIVVPVTGHKPDRELYPWLIRLDPNSTNGLEKASDADTLQVKSISTDRCIHRMGRVTADQLEEIRLGICLCVGIGQPGN